MELIEWTISQPHVPEAYSEAREEELQKALSAGLFVVELFNVPGHIVTCDFDVEHNCSPEDLLKRAKVLEPFRFQTNGEAVHTVSRGGQGFHRFYTTPALLPLSIRSTIAVALGSDPIRECVLQERILNGSPHYALMFEKLNNLENVEGFLYQFADENEFKIHLPKETK